MKLDLFEFARQQQIVSGDVPLADLTRIDTPDRRGGLAWRASGSSHGRHGGLRLDLAIDGDVVLTCQRCLQPMTESLRLRSRFLIAADDETADLLDQDDEYDAIVGSPAFDLHALIEDEVILALPIAPRHAACPDDATTPLPGSGRPSPFAVLARLKAINGATDNDPGEDH